MNLYLLYQAVNKGYDTYDAAIVCAKSEDEARQLHPSDYKRGRHETTKEDPTWCKPEQVEVTLIGSALEGSEAGVVLASFNAG